MGSGRLDQLKVKKSKSSVLANFNFTVYPMGTEKYGDISFTINATFGGQRMGMNNFFHLNLDG